LEFGVLFFVEEENRRTRRKTLEARTRTNNKPNPHINRAGIEPGSHWWKASVPTTAPSLLPDAENCQISRVFKNEPEGEVFKR